MKTFDLILYIIALFIEVVCVLSFIWHIAHGTWHWGLIFLNLAVYLRTTTKDWKFL